MADIATEMASSEKKRRFKVSEPVFAWLLIAPALAFIGVIVGGFGDYWLEQRSASARAEGGDR